MMKTRAQPVARRTASSSSTTMMVPGTQALAGFAKIRLTTWG